MMQQRQSLYTTAMALVLMLHVAPVRGQTPSDPNHTTAPALRFVITDLGTTGLRSLSPRGREAHINNRGQVVLQVFRRRASGRLRHPRGFIRSLLWQNGKSQDLGMLGGEQTEATAINDQGQVVGWSETDQENKNKREGGLVRKAFLWKNGKLRALGTGWTWPKTLSTGEEWYFGKRRHWVLSACLEPQAINNNGEIVGYVNNFRYGRPCRARNGRVVDLGGRPYGEATGINRRGQVVGAVGARKDWTAMLWDNGRSLVLKSTLGGQDSFAFAINDQGQVVGEAAVKGSMHEPEEVFHAFLWQNGKMTDLGTLGGRQSIAYAINNRGQVVGDSRTSEVKHLEEASFEITHAFLWQEGKMTDLNTLLPAHSGWVLRQASDINDLGQIVGIGDLNGQEHFFLLTPVKIK